MSDPSDNHSPSPTSFSDVAELAATVRALQAENRRLRIARSNQEKPSPKDIHQVGLSLTASRHLEKLGEGSFGIIYHYPTHSTVYKVIIDNGGEANLLQEYHHYTSMHAATPLGGRSAFITPRAWSFWSPTTEARDTNSTHTSQYMSHFQHATITLDLIPSIPWTLAEAYKNLFIAPEAQASAPRIRLLRLYFGRELPPKTTAFHPGLAADLPLDIKRYEALRAATCLPEVSDVVRGMGQLLARMHWAVGINGRDVELVLGSIRRGEHVPQCYVLDFNQCQRWLVPDPLALPEQLTYGTYAGDLCAGARRLAHIVAGQELYYPRPHQAEYKYFRGAYLDEVGVLLRDKEDPRGWKPRILGAALAFLEEFEELDRVKVERRARRAAAASLAMV